MAPYFGRIVGTDGGGRHIGSGGGGTGGYIGGGNSPTDLDFPPSFWISANKFSIDDASGTISGAAEANMLDPAQIGAHLILKWGKGAVTGDVVITASTFGSTRDATTELDKWVTEFYNLAKWEHLYPITTETDIRTAIAHICQQAPIGWARSAGTGDAYCFVYPNEAPANNSAQRFLDSGGNIVYFRPSESLNPKLGDLGKPYTLLDFSPALTSREEVYNRFRIRYRYFGPAGRTMHSQVVTETAGDCNVWSSTTHGNDGSTSGLNTAGLDYDLDAVCASSQSRYGLTRELDIECDTITRHDVATGYLHYLIRRYSNQRHQFTVTAGMSAIDLEPGMIVRFSNDCNIRPRMDYWNAPAKAAGWATLDFLVLGVVKNLNDMTVTLTVEQIVYDPS